MALAFLYVLSTLLVWDAIASNLCEESARFEGTQCHAAEMSSSIARTVLIRLEAISGAKIGSIVDDVHILLPNQTRRVNICKLDPCVTYNVTAYDFDNSTDLLVPIPGAGYSFDTCCNCTEGTTIPNPVSADAPTTKGDMPTTKSTSVVNTTSTSTVPPARVCEAAVVEGYEFQEVNFNSPAYSTEKCNGSGSPIASVRCTETGFDMSTFHKRECGKTISDVVQDPKKPLNETLPTLQTLTSNIASLTLNNISVTTDYLLNISDQANEFTEVQVQQVVEISNHLLKFYIESDETDEIDDKKQELVQSISTISRKIENSTASMETENIVIKVQNVADVMSSLTTQPSFRTNGTTGSTNFPMIITVSGGALSKAKNISNVVKVVSIGYRSSILFPSKRTTDWVMSTSLGNDTTEFRLSLDNLVNVTNEEIMDIPGTQQIDDFFDEAITVECVFWNFSLSDWSSEGCTLVEGLPTTCQCDHLTNFAILVNRVQQERDVALTIVTYIGCSLSLICLFATILIICISWRLRKKYQTQILFNICLCLFLGFLLFIFGIEPKDQGVGCSVLTVFLHYFLLAAWCWMAVYSFAIYRDVVRVIASYREKYRIYLACAFAYGVPFLTVLLNAGIALGHIDQMSNDNTDKNNSAYRANTFCWLQNDSLHFGFLLPVGLLLLFNVIVFCIIVPKLTCKRMKIQSTASKGGAKKALIIACVLTVTMGLAWILGYFMLLCHDNTCRTAFSWLFTLFNSVQGVFIFYITAVRSGEARRVYRDYTGKTSLTSASTVSTGQSPRQPANQN